MLCALGFAAIVPDAESASVVAGSTISGGRPAITPGSDEWRFLDPTASDEIHWTEGWNETDGFFYFGLIFPPEPKFNVGPPITGRPFTGFNVHDGPAIPSGSTAHTIGVGSSGLVPGLLWGTNYLAAWGVGADGILGTISSPSWQARATGNDPWTITTAQLTAIGVTGSTYDLYIAVGLESGSYSPLGGISLRVSYETASTRMGVLGIWISGSSLSVTSDVSTQIKFYRQATLDEGPTENSAQLTSLGQLRTAIGADVGVDRSLDTPVYVGVILEDLPVPTADLGDGSVAKVHVESEAHDAAGAVPGAFSSLRITGHPVSTLSWDAEPTSVFYDVVKGSLELLRASRGDFTASIQSCLADSGAQRQATDAEMPNANAGFFYVVRGVGNTMVGGTYDGGGNQVGWRDTEIRDAGGACP
jgi:hypothetical protein